MKFRIALSHSVREKIVLDLEAPDEETVELLHNDIHAQACELPGWKFDWNAGTYGEEMEVSPHAERYDIPPDGVLRVNEEGTVEVEEIAAKKVHLNTTRTKKSLQANIERALNRCESACLNDPEDKRRVVMALMEEIYG